MRIPYKFRTKSTQNLPRTPCGFATKPNDFPTQSLQIPCECRWKSSGISAKFHINFRITLMKPWEKRWETWQALPENANSSTLFFTNFHSILGSFSLHFDSILAPFGLHFGFILAQFGVFGRVLARRREKTPKCLNFEVPLGSLWAPFFTKSLSFFRSKNASLFSSILNGLLTRFWEPFGVQFASKNVPGTKKVILSKWASRLHESSIFEGRDPQNPSQRHPKIHQKNDHFLRWKNDEKWTPKGSQNDSQITPKSVPKPPWEKD